MVQCQAGPRFTIASSSHSCHCSHHHSAHGHCHSDLGPLTMMLILANTVYNAAHDYNTLVSSSTGAVCVCLHNDWKSILVFSLEWIQCPESGAVLVVRGEEWRLVSWDHVTQLQPHSDLMITTMNHTPDLVTTRRYDEWMIFFFLHYFLILQSLPMGSSGG